MGDQFNLERFVAAQDGGGTYQHAFEELRRGRKRGHWIWFVFPQLAGLGFSLMSERYAIRSLDEACAYLRHPVLGQRLVECAEALLELGGDDPVAVMGTIDALKLRSSMTLFAAAPDANPVFERVLTRYYQGRPDPLTTRLLQGG
ncbi:MAG: DUF1810 domain-containing protein [Solirubrobacteraceae bacterium]